ncbi:hypothetical protein K4H03_28390, partial [Mycobacterium tuberculosis]|nr:hypothetical protein [Mycobacterium tuberculosis]
LSGSVIGVAAKAPEAQVIRMRKMSRNITRSVPVPALGRHYNRTRDARRHADAVRAPDVRTCQFSLRTLI